MLKIIVITLLISANSFSILIDPQETGGGNVCVSKYYGAVVLVDEHLEPDFRNVDRRSWATLELSTYAGPFVGYDENGFKIRNLTKTFYARQAFRLISQMHRIDPSLAEKLIAVFPKFEQVRVSFERISLAVETDPSLFQHCRPGTIRLAMLVQKGDLITLYRRSWEMLTERRKISLIVHEAFRSVQVDYPETKLSNLDIARYTSLLTKDL